MNPDFRRQVSEWVIQRQGDVTTWTGSRTSVAEPRLPTLGSLDSYEVTAVTQEDNALWRADVKAVLLLQTAPGPDRSHPPAIVVAPFTSDASEYTLGETTLPAAEVRRQLHANLIDAFAQSGRFRVLDRANLDLREAEQALLRDGASEPRELLRLGKTKGADLLLVGHIEAFDIGDDERAFYGARFQGYEPYVRLRYRLIDAAGGEVLEAGCTIGSSPKPACGSWPGSRSWTTATIRSGSPTWCTRALPGPWRRRPPTPCTRCRCSRPTAIGST